MTQQSQATFNTAKKRALLAQWQALTVRQRLIVVAVIVGFVALNAGYSHSRKAAHQEILRQQFHLPEATTFSKFRSSRRANLQRPEIEGVVQFSDMQFRNYTTNLQNRSIWQPVPFSYDGTTISGTYSSKALVWTDTMPSFVGDRRVRQWSLSDTPPNSLGSRKYFCLAIQKIPDVTFATPAKEYQFHYAASACSELSRQEKVIANILGALDYKNHTLHMAINGYYDPMR